MKDGVFHLGVFTSYYQQVNVHRFSLVFNEEEGGTIKERIKVEDEIHFNFSDDFEPKELANKIVFTGNTYIIASKNKLFQIVDG